MSTATPTAPTPQRDREPAISLLLYYLLRNLVVYPLFKFYFRGRVEGLENVPMAGKLLVVSNHASDFDPPFVATAVSRPVAFMAKEELFKIPLLGPAIRHYGAYPVKRGSADRAALRAALTVVDEGWATGLFLDGTRTPDGRIHNPKVGAALIASKTQAPVLPVSIWGADKIFQPGSKWPRPVPLTVRIGEPMAPPPPKASRQELDDFTQLCADRIHGQLDLGR
ncbi:MAG: lysophospholipid acyltransferase family protein [Cyanophyceae cyanobacterium]